MASTFLPAVGRIAVCGGTHGNELSGVYLVQEMERMRKEKGDNVWPVPVITVLSNPQAVKECKRYIGTDLNRCFSSATLSAPITDSTPYEVRRAQELNALLGPKESAGATDLICDLHNTTSNLGLTLIHYTTDDWLTLHICKYLQARATDANQTSTRNPLYETTVFVPFVFVCMCVLTCVVMCTFKKKITRVPVRVLVMDIPISAAYSLETVSKHGFSIEVGPQPSGVIRADIYEVMKEAVDLTMDWIKIFNSGTVFEGGDIEVFILQKSIDYPREPSTRELIAAIHPQLQDRDFCLLKRGDPVFLTFSGETVKYEDDETLHPFFINECAYYEKGIAFHLAKKRKLSIPRMQVQK
ncbi:N-acyl-aromatic-L-amino acid amidohydrolase (carboxylate-forming) B [Triplophysa tibetana]|uniref:N-acyl-aromatic-L-amino acid amidohydrolase (Carboxylate-forming) B n=1 Tax=Triplophysa tibetana TaxID=1572043 RepID=A0A5A9PJR9_9TELE|nr:N-acyl-aromatic-L-amino acid amidohydrolase (carboxylate-forming) B [Triplophysa tibetana]